MRVVGLVGGVPVCFVQIALLAGVLPGLVLLNDAASRYRASVMLFQRLVFQQRAASPIRRPDASASTLPILRASSPAPCPQASCCIRSARRGFAVSGVGPRSYRILDGSSLDDCRSARDGATCSWGAHPYTAAQAFLPRFLFIVVVSPRERLSCRRSRNGHGHRRGPASALASLAQFARASAFPVFLPSADCCYLCRWRRKTVS